MLASQTEKIIIFIACCCMFVMILIGFIVMMVYQHQQRQKAFFKSMQDLAIIHENEILQSRLEIQEQTFQNISREIHDNIGQKLSLAKLNLNTIQVNKNDHERLLMIDSVKILTDAISDLSDLSRSMSAEQILHNGLLSALEYEVAQLQKSGIFKAVLVTKANTLYLDRQKELVLFRIVQEAINNIVKHAKATEIELELRFEENMIYLSVKDNGTGFFESTRKHSGIGLLNMKKRAEIIEGELIITTLPGSGTTLTIKLPSQYETSPTNQYHTGR